MHGSFVNNDTQRAGREPCSRGVRTVDASACRRRSTVILGSADWQRTDFLSRGRDVAITMNSIKILHAVRSAFTAKAPGFHSNNGAFCSSEVYIISWAWDPALMEVGNKGRMERRKPQFLDPVPPLLVTVWLPSWSSCCHFTMWCNLCV